MRFVDMFAGIGGFHLAMSALPIDTECVFACENNDILQDMYDVNFDMRPYGDVRNLDPCKLPQFDILLGGWPCQPFAHCGHKKGFADETRGDLFFYIEDILRNCRPRYFLLENIWHLTTKDFATEYAYILDTFRSLGYDVIPYKLSPTQFGTPQHRKRVFFMGSQTPMRRMLIPHHSLHDFRVAPFGDSIRNLMLSRCEAEYLPINRVQVRKRLRRFIVQHHIVDGDDYLFQMVHTWEPLSNLICIDKGGGGRDSVKTLLTQSQVWPVHLQKPYRMFTPREGARLQNLPDSLRLPSRHSAAYAAVGNAINVKVAQRILEFHLLDIVHPEEASGELR